MYFWQMKWMKYWRENRWNSEWLNEPTDELEIELITEWQIYFQPKSQLCPSTTIQASILQIRGSSLNSGPSRPGSTYRVMTAGTCSPLAHLPRALNIWKIGESLGLDSHRPPDGRACNIAWGVQDFPSLTAGAEEGSGGELYWGHPGVHSSR